MPNNTPTPPYNYYPRLSNLITLDSLPSSLDFVKNIAQSIFSKIYYKNYQGSISPLGNSAFYSLSIVSKTRLEFNLVYGLKFVLNRDHQDNSISSFPVTVQYNWPVIAYLSQFNLDSFSFSPEEIYNIALVSLNISEETVINEAINVFTDTTGDPIHKFVDDLNAELGSSLSTPIPYPTSENRIEELTQSINASYGEGAAFATYILDSSNLSNTKNNLKLFFKRILPQDVEDYIKSIIKPHALVTLESSASIEFPRNVLRPWIAQNVNGSLVLTPDPDESHKTSFDFAKAIFYADTEAGIGYNLDLAGTLGPTAYSEIASTGLLIQIERLKIDLSKTKNIPEADAFGYPADFTGVYADALSVTLPPKWFSKDQDIQSTLRIAGYNLIIGSGGVTGTFALEAVAVSDSLGNVTSFYGDKFTFNYPVTAYKTDANQTIVPVEILDDVDLLNYINSLPDESRYTFKYPLSVTEAGTNTIEEFSTQDQFRAYINSFYTGNYDYMWLRLGKEPSKSWRLGFKKFDISFFHGQVTSSHLEGRLEIKKFKKIDSNGNPEILYIDILGEWESSANFKLSAAFTPGLKMNLFNILDFYLQNIEIGKQNDNFFITADTKIEFPEGSFGAKLLNNKPLDLPAIRYYASGKFEIIGGAAIIPTNLHLDIGPVKMAVTGLHFGTIQRERNGVIRSYNYVGFDGGISVSPLGLDVKGNGVKYYYTNDNDEHGGDGDSYFHISTLEVDLIIPGSASADSAVAIIKGALTIPEPGVSTEYRGKVSIKLPKAKIYGSAEMAFDPKYPGFFVDASVEFPSAIPLGTFGIFGFRGLIGYRYVAEKRAVPGMTDNDSWYDYYIAPKRGINMDKFIGPKYTQGYSNAFSIGFGASLGTMDGSGSIASLRAMMLLSIPSMFCIDAGLTILSSRLGLAEDDPKEPPFYAFVIIGDDSLELGAGANYQLNKKNGYIVDIKAEIQMGFFFKNQKPWYINFGTKQKPITITVFKNILSLKMQGFLMISAKGIEAGMRIDINLNLFILKAWIIIDTGGYISFEKRQLGGYMYFEGGAELNLFIIKVSVVLSTYFRVELEKPFLILAELFFEFKFKILFIKIKIKVHLVLKWEKNGDLDTTPIAPITNNNAQANDEEYPKYDQTENAVKGIHMLTAEEFIVTYFDYIPNPDNQLELEKMPIIPLDTYIDIKAEKGLIPSSATDLKIGGHSSGASNYLDLIPPQKVQPGGHVLRQVKHKYSIEDVTIKFYKNGQWKDYHPFEAIIPEVLPPNSPLQNAGQFKIGFWQKNNDQYDTIRILGMSPFSFLEQGLPGWFIPEQYGITPSEMFCTEHIETWHTSNVENEALGTLFYPPTQYPSQLIDGAYYLLMGGGAGSYIPGPNGTLIFIPGTGTMEVSNAANPHGYSQSLKFSNSNTLVITLPEESGKVRLWLTTLGSGVTIRLYKNVYSNSIMQNYQLITEIYKTKIELAGVVEYLASDFSDQYVSKIEIIPNQVNQSAIDAVNIQIAQLWADAAAQNNGEVSIIILTPQQQQTYDYLLAQLNELTMNSCSGSDCQKDPILCEFLENLISTLNNCINYQASFQDNWKCFLGMVDMIIEFDQAYPQYNLYHQLETEIQSLLTYPERVRPPVLGGALQEAQIIFNHISQIGDCDCKGDDNGIKECVTSLQQVSWLTAIDYEYQQTIPSQPAVQQDVQLMTDAITHVVQPIWRPNTVFCLHMKLKDQVNDANDGIFDYYYGFRTAGPLGHFEKRRLDYIKPDTTSEQYPITTLKSYIDMRRSYPNADGNLNRAKPLFYGHNQCNINIFFITPYIFNMFKEWKPYQGAPKLLGAINIAIKDPVTDVIIPYPLPSNWAQNETVPTPDANGSTWVDDNGPNLPVNIQILNSYIQQVNANNSSIHCSIDLGDPIKPLAYSYTVTLTNLKPEKLYTAIMYNAFDEDENGMYEAQKDSNNKILYEENQKVHDFVFQTSRYADFKEQVESFMLKEYDDQNVLVDEKDAVYNVKVNLKPQQIDDMYLQVSGNGSNALLEQMSDIYSDPFDRVIEGIMGIQPLDVAKTTEFVKIIDETENVIALIVRNPEPFNDPKIPTDELKDTLKVLSLSGQENLEFKVLFSKDASQILIMHKDKKIENKELSFKFRYKTWNGTAYQIMQELITKIININD
ncbi:hypothetical protein ACM39_03620 [Chryseobacterium sp. FH2]|uniref:hypothetical protein n=1 Tax=Chryseobacterium sp. FH2 TaxID=1674291 RepID=UPI00065AD743|nr:hypothetical protein [Chryseobacterium sp. FH2]KMQ69204.1 hypothetical protein ACM39_03620 [Chryseobacterium sp. FH2]